MVDRISFIRLLAGTLQVGKVLTFLCVILIKSYVITKQRILSNSLLIVIMLYN